VIFDPIFDFRLLEFHLVDNTWYDVTLHVHVCWGSNCNSHYFHTIGNGHQPIVGVYMPIRRILWDDHPQYQEFRLWHM